MERTQAAHMPLLRSLPTVTVQDRNKIKKINQLQADKW
jgi:hypothetical protein